MKTRPSWLTFDGVICPTVEYRFWSTVFPKFVQLTKPVSAWRADDAPETSTSTTKTAAAITLADTPRWVMVLLPCFCAPSAC